MGQSVGNLARNYKKDKRHDISVDNMNTHTFGNMKTDDGFYLSGGKSFFESSVVDRKSTSQNRNGDGDDPDDPNSESNMVSNSSTTDYNPTKHNVADIAAKIIPQSAWSGFQLFQLSNEQHVTTRFLKNTAKIQPHIGITQNNKSVIISNEQREETEQKKVISFENLQEPVNNSPEMEHLISLMQNHRVSENTSAFSFFHKEEQSPSDQTHNQQQANSIDTNQQRNTHVDKIFRNIEGVPTKIKGYEDDDFQPEVVEERSLPMNEISSPEERSQRKILPLKKSRWKRMLEKKNTNRLNWDTPIYDSHSKIPENENQYIPSPKSNDEYFGYTNEDDRPSPSVYNDPFKFYPPSTENHHAKLFNTMPQKEFDFSIEPSLKVDPTDIANLKAIKSKFKELEKEFQTRLPEATKKTKQPAVTNKKKKNNGKKRKNEIAAPGGFLSSDLTLFDNPISDDFICLFCQYDIFKYGLKDAKKKNGYYRRKHQIV